MIPRVQKSFGKKCAGFTLLELFIALLIMSILVTVALPNMSNLTEKKRLIGAAEQISSHLQQARSEAIARSSTVFAKFAGAGTTAWTYAFSENTACVLTQTDPTQANACVMITDDGDGDATDATDRILTRFVGADYRDVSIAYTDVSITFDSLRGTTTTGAVTLTANDGEQLTVNVNVLGNVTICSVGGSITGYRTC